MASLSTPPCVRMCTSGQEPFKSDTFPIGKLQPEMSLSKLGKSWLRNVDTEIENGISSLTWRLFWHHSVCTCAHLVENLSKVIHFLFGKLQPEMSLSKLGKSWFGNVDQKIKNGLNSLMRRLFWHHSVHTCAHLVKNLSKVIHFLLRSYSQKCLSRNWENPDLEMSTKKSKMG